MDILEKNIDYKEIGFKSGLEIHQQLDTNKLFCNCPSLLRQDLPSFEIKRKLHSVAGQEGELDSAVIYESSKDKEFIYQAYDTTCLVELDEMPPYEINKEALEIVIQISLLLNCRILPISQIMRKTVIDGSNTSGFQRTVLIGDNGWIITKSGRVGIKSICLEEDSARIIDKKENVSVFRLDRLGIPLIEIVTEPDLVNPEHVKEVALYIGGLLRSFKIKRGIGSIRQDVNISIKHSERVEIKGFQDPNMMVETINQEIKRQLSLVQRGEFVKSEVRNALPDGSTEFLRPMPGSARMYPETDLPLLKISKEMINHAKNNMPKTREEIEKELKNSGLNQELIKLVLNEDKLEDFKFLLKYTKDNNLAAKVLLIYPKEIASHKKKDESEIDSILTLDVLSSILESFESKKISQGQIKKVLEKISEGESIENALNFEKEDISNLEEKIFNLIKEKPGLSENAYMGILMKELKSNISPKDILSTIRKFLNN
ncbi:Glu-tRNA(Gln) amidotransferase subunit GatE [Candidatus Woesearchaeota archaeon]|nr:Glu-tRNA(Gln) amidotransferase subunit GatE [Candidatus Woesearchaeota archaeon]